MHHRSIVSTNRWGSSLVRRSAVLAVVAASVAGLGAASPTLAAGSAPESRGNERVSLRQHAAEVPDGIEALDLTCRAAGTDSPAIGCVWREPTHLRAAGVRLVRISTLDDTRMTIYRSGDLSITNTLDERVRPGVRYGYRLVALSSTGRVVGLSRPAIAGVPGDSDPSVEVLRLDCEQISSGRIACAWSEPGAHDVRRLTLWRSVDGAARERVASFPAPVATFYVDHVPDGTARVVYAVIAERGDGTIVARSRPDGLALRTSPPAPRNPDVSPRPAVTIDATPSTPAEVSSPSSTVPVRVVPENVLPDRTMPPSTDATSAPEPTESQPTESEPTEPEPARPQRAQPPALTPDASSDVGVVEPDRAPVDPVRPERPATAELPSPDSDRSDRAGGASRTIDAKATAPASRSDR